MSVFLIFAIVIVVYTLAFQCSSKLRKTTYRIGYAVTYSQICFFVGSDSTRARNLARKISEIDQAKDTTPTLNKRGNVIDDLSRPARGIMISFNDLPEINRPPYDVRAALVALDKKYSIQVVNNHFTHQGRCNCRDISQHDSNPVCKRYPEYSILRKEFKEINKALALQKRAEARREREIMLAGIENDLRSVDDIVNSLRTEREAIDETTKELKV